MKGEIRIPEDIVKQVLDNSSFSQPLGRFEFAPVNEGGIRGDGELTMNGQTKTDQYLDTGEIVEGKWVVQSGSFVEPQANPNGPQDPNCVPYGDGTCRWAPRSANHTTISHGSQYFLTVNFSQM